MVTTPMASGIRPARANWHHVEDAAVTTSATIRMAAEISHSEDSSKPSDQPLRRHGDQRLVGGAQVGERRWPAAACSRSPMRACSPWARVSR